MSVSVFILIGLISQKKNSNNSETGMSTKKFRYVKTSTQSQCKQASRLDFFQLVITVPSFPLLFILHPHYLFSSSLTIPLLCFVLTVVATMQLLPLLIIWMRICPQRDCFSLFFHPLRLAFIFRSPLLWYAHYKILRNMVLLKNVFEAWMMRDCVAAGQAATRAAECWIAYEHLQQPLKRWRKSNGRSH